MSLKGSAIFPGQLHRLKFGISGVLDTLPCWRPLVRSAVSTPGLSYQKEDGCSIVQREGPGHGSELCSSISAEEADLHEDKERRERRLWEKGLRKSIYERLRKDRITVELFPELNFALDGNYYPKLVPLVAQKINSLLDKDADDEIAELLDFLGISLTPHLVGEVLKLPNDWGVSLRFFVWAKYQPEYEHNAHSYSQLLCNLARSKKEKPDYLVATLELLQEMIRKGLAPSIVAVNIVIDRLCKANKTKVALSVMRELEGNGVLLDLFTYNSIINGLGKSGRFKEVFKLLEEMEMKSIQPDLLTYNSIIHSLGNSGRWLEARKVFDELPDRGLTPDVVTYNSLICGLFKSGEPDEAFKVFGLMSLRGCEPDVVTYNSLIYGLAKARRLEDALNILRFMKERNCDPDIITYNTLIGELIFRIVASLQATDMKYLIRKLFELLIRLRTCPDLQFGTSMLNPPDSGSPNLNQLFFQPPSNITQGRSTLPLQKVLM
ncbi:hypothetical protein R1flu_021261 [Riccia fluitans]|uniref:Pentatricopeptide repeat-containing protein n=1 Tax=Riccia fluitans TaxID=41844 RepID=A0ABD1ZP26_9MARC